MQQGGSQYGVPPTDMTQFTPTGTGRRAQMLGISGPDQLQQQQHQLAEAASPISSRPPPPQPVVRPPNFDELVPGGFAEDDALAAASGEEAERSGVPGNRWPRQETLALLKIRSEMDAAFRDATLKGPLWEDVSRKLAELGYSRSAKKCKEKFENVHKYYKRTKEGRAGRQDGKNYRFFSQLEALHSSSSASATPNTTTSSLTMTSSPPATAPLGVGTSSLAGSSTRLHPSPISAAPPPPFNTTTLVATNLTAAGTSVGISSSAAAAGISFPSNTSSSSSSDSDDEATEEGAGAREGKKRKHSGSGGGSRKMIAFFEGLMKQVIERQEAMQQRFLEAIEKREQDRMIREEAWRRQEMTRLAREHELISQDRAMAASRDTAVIAFLQKVSDQNIQLPPHAVIPGAPPPQASPAPPIPLQQHQQPPQPQQSQQQPPPKQHHHHTEIARHQASSSSDLVPVLESQETVGSGGLEPVTSSSRWPKSEVHALIKLRSGLESRYQETGPKNPLWEEISAEMHKLGYNRSAKRCKEKWENINKYFKKVKESNKKRPEDAKTCPYFHQLDALYRKKHLSGGGGSSSGTGSMLGNQRQKEQETNPNPQERSNVLQIMAPPVAPPSQQPQPEADVKSGNNNRHDGNTEGGNGSTCTQIPTSNGGFPPSFFEEGNSSSSTMKKPEDIMKEQMEQQHQAVMDDYDKLEEPDSDNMDRECDDEDDEDDEDTKMQYKIQFQRQNVGNGGGSAANAPSKGATTPAGSFLAMVQ